MGMVDKNQLGFFSVHVDTNHFLNIVLWNYEFDEIIVVYPHTKNGTEFVCQTEVIKKQPVF